MDNQASEDELIELATKFNMDEYGTVNENGGYLIGEVRKLIRTEKLKLLAEVRERVDAEPCEPDCTKERHAYHQGQWDMQVEVESVLAKLEAEL